MCITLPPDNPIIALPPNPKHPITPDVDLGNVSVDGVATASRWHQSWIRKRYAADGAELSLPNALQQQSQSQRRWRLGIVQQGRGRGGTSVVLY